MNKNKTYHLLYLEDSPEDAELFTATLKREYLPCEVTWVNGRDAFASALAGGWNYDLIFSDFSLPDIRGEDALALAKQQYPDVPFIFLSGILGEEKAVECLKNGATDYVLKSNLSRLGPVVRRALEEARLASARREAEAATHRVVSLLRATLESTAEGILVVDLAGRVTTYNRKFMALCGIPDYVMAPMEMDRVLQFLLDQFEDPEAFLAETRLLATQPDRESFGMLTFKGNRKLEEFSRPHRVGDQTVGRVYTFQDVTARERQQEHLTGLARNHQRLLEASGASGLVPWCLTEDSLLLPGFAAAVLGLEPAGLPKDLPELEALIHPKELDRLQEALEHPGQGPFDLRLRKGDGSWIWTRWHLTRDPAAGYRGTFQDIDAQRRSDEASSDRRRLQGMAFLAGQQNRVLGGFLEDLRAGLGALSASQPDLPPGPLLACTRTLEGIQDHMDRVDRALACEAQPLQRANLSRALAALKAPPGDGPCLEADLEKDFPELPMAQAHLEALLDALLRNAGEALQGTGRIRIGARRDTDGSFRLEVEDRGPGIPEGVRSRMFEPFFTTQPGHLGLGLSTVQTLVRAYRGRIEVDSAAGKGTVMRVLLPGAP